MRLFVVLVLLLTSSLFSLDDFRTLYKRLDPTSISEHFAFHELYAETDEGKAALKTAWKLLRNEDVPDFVLPTIDIREIIALVNPQPEKTENRLAEEQLLTIEHLGAKLSNRKLKGHQVWNREEMLLLPSEEIDLARAVLLEEFGEDHPVKIRQYEAALDLMAFQLLARLGTRTTDLEKIDQINHFIFHEMQFRFPPHSLSESHIDLYTILPSVLDQREGVCLGVSVLYLSLAQRIDLSLEIVTPPGHIYLRKKIGDRILNIETTARGVHHPTEHYLDINTRSLQTRTIKETVGLVLMNQASFAWRKEDFDQSIRLYKRALNFVPDDPLAQALLGYQYLFSGKVSLGIRLLKKIMDQPFDEEVSKEMVSTIAEDFIIGRVSLDGVKAVLGHVDEGRKSVLKKQKELKKILARWPSFRAGWLGLAGIWFQLGRQKEAMDALTRYHQIDSQNATVEYHLAGISYERMDYLKAWDHLLMAETITSARNHYPKCLKDLRTTLLLYCPER